MEQSIAAPTHPVTLIDERLHWVRRPRHLVTGLLAVAGLLLVIVFAIYGHRTSVAVTRDVASATSNIVSTILVVPINILEGLISFVIPLLILGEFVRRRHWRQLLTSIAAAAVGVGVSYLGVWFFDRFFPTAMITSDLTADLRAQSFITLLPYVAVISSLLTVSSAAKPTKISRSSWWLLGIVLLLSVLQGDQSLSGALITVLVGISTGHLMLYALGDNAARANGAALVQLVRRAGMDASRIVRVDNAPEPLTAWSITSPARLGYGWDNPLGQIRNALADEAAPTATVTALDIDVDTIVERARSLRPVAANSLARNYVVYSPAGTFHAVVIDSDQIIVSQLTTLWHRLRLTSAGDTTDRSIIEKAQNIVLKERQAIALGVSPAREIRIAATELSALVAFGLVGAHPLSHVSDDAAPSASTELRSTETESRSTEQAGNDHAVNQAPAQTAASQEAGASASDDNETAHSPAIPDLLTDTQLDQLWRVLQRAHRAGLSHQNIHAGVVTLTDGEVGISDWENGAIASTELARTVDLAQTLAMLTVLVGVDRAVASAKRSLPRAALISIAPAMQRSILPAPTRAELGDKKRIEAVRNALIDEIPEAKDVGLVQFNRFQPKTVITLIIGVAAVFILLGSINFQDLKATVSQANPWLMVVAFLVGLVTYVGAAIILQALSAEKLRLREGVLAQLAGSVVVLVAPAGIGPAAINLRYLQKQGMKTAVAVATVTLSQVLQFLCTVALLVALALLTGDFGTLSMPSSSALVGIAIAVVAIAALFAIKPLRRWLWKKLQPSFEQIWPRLAWLMTHPGRLGLATLGALLQTAGYVAAFGFSLAAFGESLSLTTLALTYLVSNSVGSVIPTPGGIGPVEAALTGGLTLAGVPYSVAFSTAVLYRVLTFWARVPLGWGSLRWMEKKDLL